MRWRPERGAAPRKILVIQLRRIGDAVLITPALDAIRDAWPEAEIHLLTSGAIPDLFENDPRVARIWTEPRGRPVGWLVLEIRRARFDLVLDFQSIPLTAALSFLSGAYAVGFEKPYRRFCYRRVASLADHEESEYTADHKLDLLRALGLTPRLAAPRLAVPGSSDAAGAAGDAGLRGGAGVAARNDHPLWSRLPSGPRVALVPTNKRAHKRWPASGFAETARLLNRETGAVFAIVGGPGEEASLEEVAALLGEVPHLLHTFSRLGEFASLLASADLYLGNDTGPRHIALALGVPTIAHFSTSNPTHWTPPGSDRHLVVWDPKRAKGRPVREDLRIVEESPEAVARGAASLLRSVLERR